MKTTGIITEYNPFHQGHCYHIQKAKELTQCDVLIAVMSGNFVQRGEMAIVDKWQRAQAAIENGVDLVIELPYLYATQSASQFAKAAVQLLHLADVDNIVFGSESNDLDKLKEIASMSFNVDYLKEALNAGEGYAKAYSLGSVIMQPNDILAIAYLKELSNTSITPYCIQRTNHYHDTSVDTEIASATAIRKAYFEKGFQAENAPLLIQEPTVCWEKFYPVLRVLFQTLSSNEMKEIFLFNEGIENHLRKQMQASISWEDFLERSVNKRYTKARIQRTCLQLLNHITKQEAAELEPLDTLRILAMNQNGQKYLKELKKKEVKIASRFAQVPYHLREMELKTTRLYASLMDKENYQKLVEKEIGGAMRILRTNKIE